MPTSYTLIDSPVGELLLTTDGESITRLHFSADPSEHEIDSNWNRDDHAAPLDEAKRQMTEYFAGARKQFDLPIAPSGTEFQKSVWKELVKIPYGQTISYGQLAQRIGNPRSSRAVGLANGRNPIGIIVPCHRVIGADGSLTGFAGGLANKRVLLDLEELHAGTPRDCVQQSLALA